MKDRLFYLDNITSLLLFHMIYIVHIADSCGGFNPQVINIIKITFSFFMSWFFFKGGMMHKESTFKEILLKSSKRLLLPYIIFLFIGIVLDYVIKFSTNDEITTIVFLKQELITFLGTSIIWPTGATWFLLSLFVVRVVFNYLCSRVHALFLSAFSALVAYGIYVLNCWDLFSELEFLGLIGNLTIPCYLGNMWHGLSLYSLGYFLKNKQYNNVIFWGALLLFVLKYFLFASIDFRANIPSSDSIYLLAVLYGMTGCIVIDNIFKKIFNVKIPIVTHIGNNSMLYYLIHYPVMYTTINLFWDPVSDSALWVKYIYLAFIVTLSLLIAEFIFKNKRLRFIIGG